MGRSRASRTNGTGNGVEASGEEEAGEREAARPLKKRDSRHKGEPSQVDSEPLEPVEPLEPAQPLEPEAGKDAKDADADADAEADADEESDEEYEVEAILNTKKVKGKTHFLIRWKGYESESDSWEPEDTLSCPDIIAKYKEQQVNGKVKAGSKRKAAQKPEKAKKLKTGKKSSKKDFDYDNADESAEYEVEKILEVHHKKNGNRDFLIRWKGWDASHNTWEPEKNLNCGELIKKFMEKVSAKKSASPRDLRVAPSSTKRFTLAMKNTGRRLSKRGGNRQRVRYDDAE